MSGMRARGWRRQGGAMDVTLGVRPGDDGTVVAVSGEVDVCTEAPLQQALLRIMREHGARLLKHEKIKRHFKESSTALERESVFRRN